MRDTVSANRREICVWERDLTGYPVLRCYPGYFPREWYLYNFSPWWYRNDEHVYNRNHCPAYYYYDEKCGCCRYYLNNPDLSREEMRQRDRAKYPYGSGRPEVVSTVRDTLRDTTVRVSVTNRTGTRISTSANRPQGFITAGNSGSTGTVVRTGDTLRDSTRVVATNADSTVVRDSAKTVLPPAQVQEPARVRRTMRSR